MNIIDKTGLLSPDQKKLLQEAASLEFSLGGFKSLDDILTTFNVDVIIDGELKHRIVPWEMMEEAEKYWRKKYEEACKRCKDGKSKEMMDAEENLTEINITRNVLGDLFFLGLYAPSPYENYIKLFPNAMKEFEDGNKMDELLVSVLAHEVMHVYFNRPGHKKFPYAMFFEEPLAEFGMLVYLDETNSPYTEYVHTFVREKKTCYRFGAQYFDEYKAGDSHYRDILEDYKFELEDDYLTTNRSMKRYLSHSEKGKKGLSKSGYTLSRQCQKALWLSIYDKDKETEDPTLQARLEEEKLVNNLAMGLFGPYMDVTVKVGGGTLDLPSMIQRTKDCLTAGVENIGGASFAFQSKKFGKNYCTVDILRKNGDGYDIYEVKSSTDEPLNGSWEYGIEEQEKDDNPKKLEEKLRNNTLDIVYKKWVLEKCGLKINNCFLIQINKKYRRKKTLSVPDLFVITDMNRFVATEYPNVEENVLEAQRTISSLCEPKEKIGLHCEEPHQCAFKDYCFTAVPKPSVLDLYHMNKKKKWALYDKGKHIFSDLGEGEYGKSEVRSRQVEGRPYIDKVGIKEFLDKIHYPLYFLDFETMMFAIPPYDGLKPYQQIPFQYSLHFRHDKEGTLYHREYLAESGVDPRKELAERLCKDIPLDSCVVAYNKSFEGSRLKELADFYPQLSDHLRNIADHLVDLIEPFRAAYYYLPAMGGSLSIKSVLPALFPKDPSLDYHNLEGGVQNGGEAMTIFPKIKNMPEPQRTQTRKALLDYCKLDTLAMVKILDRLYYVVNKFEKEFFDGEIKGKTMEVDDFEIKIYDDNTCQITQYNGYKKVVIIPDTIHGHKVEAIGDAAFSLNEHIVSVVLPDSVEVIGTNAFNGCSNLTTVEFHNNPVQGMILYSGAFAFCTSLASIKIPEKTIVGLLSWHHVRNHCNGIFEGCENLVNLDLPKTAVLEYTENMFKGCDKLPGHLVTCFIEEQYEFDLSFPINPKTGCIWIGNKDECKEVFIPQDVQRIPYDAFVNCTKLTTVHIPEGVTEIERRAFYGCSSLTNVKIPKSVKTCYFENCKSISSIVIPSGLNYYSFEECTNLTDVIIEEGATCISIRAFTGCVKLTKVKIPASVEEIGKLAFCGCTGLVHVDIPDSVKEICDDSFKDCPNLVDLNIPDGCVVRDTSNELPF